MNTPKRKLKLKGSFNNIYDTDEILWLLKGSENMSAFDFVCKQILNVEPKNIFDAFEYEE